MHSRHSRRVHRAIAAAALAVAAASAGAATPGETPALGKRLSQETVAQDLTLRQARREGMRVFSTPFNRLDGVGDGPMDPIDPTVPGGRPALGSNGTFLRMNGLDSQTCLECHSALSTRTIPQTFAVGGHGGIAATAFPGVLNPDIGDSQGRGFAATDGRMINPPFLFGAGGVELIGKEMTVDLQALRATAEANPGTEIALVTKGVDFGTIVFEGGVLDTSNVVGVDADLVVRPFGRKGGFATIRDFDIGAMMFHHGIQPVEVVGEDVDADGDGVANELTVGEMSALHVFGVSMERPRAVRRNASARNGRRIFRDIGCASCHRPALTSDSPILMVSFPEVPTEPTANVYFTIDLSAEPTGFTRAGRGVRVPMYADLKRHDLGPGLAEATGSELDPWFTTARLWGVADTAPYLHDGRATTLTDAILWHGGEAQASRDAFDSLAARDKVALLSFLRTLRVPKEPNADLAKRAERHHHEHD